LAVIGNLPQLNPMNKFTQQQQHFLKLFNRNDYKLMLQKYLATRSAHLMYSKIEKKKKRLFHNFISQMRPRSSIACTERTQTTCQIVSEFNFLQNVERIPKIIQLDEEKSPN